MTTRSHLASLPLLLLALGCGDPVPNVDPGPPPAPEPPPPADGEPAALNPQGAAAAPNAPPPAAGGPPGSKFVIEDGEGVEISGTIRYAGAAQGKLFLDVLDASPDTPEDSVRLLHSTTVEAPGAWTIVAPKGRGPVRLCAFIDVDDNGPTPADPKVVTPEPIDIGSSPIHGVTLELVDDWDAQNADRLSLYQSGSDAMPPPADQTGPEAIPQANVDGEPVPTTEPPQAELQPSPAAGEPAATP